MPKRSAQNLSRMLITLTTVRIVTMGPDSTEEQVMAAMDDLDRQITKILQAEFDTRAEEVRRAIEETRERLNGKA